MQALYQVFWMLLILFAAPVVFNRYYVRNKCEIYRQEGFCSSSDVRDLALLKGAAPTDFCKQYVFPPEKGPSSCPAFKEPSLETLNATAPLAGTCIDPPNGDNPCQGSLDDAEKVRTSGQSKLWRACS
jgi:hypothetical protein